MCSRYTLKERPLKEYPLKLIGDFIPNYNLAPTQQGLVITSDEPEIIQPMHFGLIPFWAKDTRLNISTLNARSEEVMDKKTYSPLIIHSKTCLVLADGFYEWDKKSGKPVPYYFTLTDRQLFAFAGLWSEWKSKNLIYRSFTIMTCESNAIVGKVHDPKFRMPVILEKLDEKIWLDKTISPKEKLKTCDKYPNDLMQSHQVSQMVNATVIKGTINNNPNHIIPINSQ